LLAVAFIGTGLAVVGQLWSVSARRSDEQELLYVGDSFRRAIASYYRAGIARQFPQSLEDLLLDTRNGKLERHLRKIYADPITRQPDWELVTAEDGGIMGVASRSHRNPMKRANFASQDAAFDGVECYCEWQFLFMPHLPQTKRTR
jgi:type II secretory pathway pseudopilin PulG